MLVCVKVFRLRDEVWSRHAVARVGEVSCACVTHGYSDGTRPIENRHPHQLPSINQSKGPSK
jgi:hypothetical protein